jgi:hypothetical protein
MDSKYPGIIQEARAALSIVVAPRKASVYVCRDANMVEVRAYSRELLALFPQHGPGPKHERAIVLELWQEAIVEEYPEQFLRGLIHSDGCRCTNKVWGGKYAYPRYFFSQVSRDIMGLFCRTCERLEIEYRWCTWKQLSIAKAASVARLDEFVGPKA